MKKQTRFVFIFFGLILMQFSCTSVEVPELEIVELVDSIWGKDYFLVLDTREEEEYNVSHLTGAHFAGYNTFEFSDWDTVPKERFIILYCSVGKRSGEIGEQFIQNGYRNVYNLKGGIFNWVNTGFAVGDSSGQETTKVHGYTKFFGRMLDKGEVVYE